MSKTSQSESLESVKNGVDMNLSEQLMKSFLELNLYAEQVRNFVLPQFRDDYHSAIEKENGIVMINPISSVAMRLSHFGYTEFFDCGKYKKNMEEYFIQFMIDNLKQNLSEEYSNIYFGYYEHIVPIENDIDSSWDLDIEKAANMYAEFYHIRRLFLSHLDENYSEKSQLRNPQIGRAYAGVPEVEYLENRPYFYTKEMVARTIEILTEKYGYKFTYNSVENGNYEKYFLTGIRRDDPNRIVFKNQDDIRQIVWIIE
jgi:hypothetical protein